MNEERDEILLEKVREVERRDKNELREFEPPMGSTAKLLGEERILSGPLSEKEADEQMGARTRRTFIMGAAAAVAGIFGLKWLRQPENTDLFERMFRWNERVAGQFFENSDLAPEFPRDRATSRVNGWVGLDKPIDVSTWKLRVAGLAQPEQHQNFVGTEDFQGLEFTLDQIKQLPQTEMTTEFKCIEGWSVIVNWTGVRFSDFAAQFFPVLRTGQRPDVQNLPESLTRYVSLVTPDQQYYVGWDMQSILHPQTLLAWAMNGEPLTQDHGAPLRLVTTTKYGIKQLKRIGLIEFTNTRPEDYWAKEGYDWYSGH